MEENQENTPQTDITINEVVDGFFSFFGSIIGNLASNIAPLGAGIMPAVMTYHNVTEVLGYAPWVGWCAAGVVEFMGLGAAQEAMIVWNQRRQYKDEKEKMPIWAPMTSVVWYIAIMIIFNVLLEIQWAPENQIWAEGTKIISQALFATLAIPGYTLIAAKTLRKEWLLRKAEDKAERKAERIARREEERRLREEELRLREQGQRQQDAPEDVNLRENLRIWMQAQNIKPWEVGGHEGAKISPAQIADQWSVPKEDKTTRDNIRKYTNQFKKEPAELWA